MVGYSTSTVMINLHVLSPLRWWLLCLKCIAIRLVREGLLEPYLPFSVFTLDKMACASLLTSVFDC